MINFYELRNLWPGLILRFEDFWCWTRNGISALLLLVINGDGTPKGRKLMFSRLEFAKMHTNWLQTKSLKLSEEFLKATKKLYIIKLEDPRYFNLLNRSNVINEMKRQYSSKWNELLWKFYSKINFDYSKIIQIKKEGKDIIILNNLFYEGENKTLSQLEFRDFEFYK